MTAMTAMTVNFVSFHVQPNPNGCCSPDINFDYVELRFSVLSSKFPGKSIRFSLVGIGLR